MMVPFASPLYVVPDVLAEQNAVAWDVKKAPTMVLNNIKVTDSILMAVVDSLRKETRKDRDNVQCNIRTTRRRVTKTWMHQGFEKIWLLSATEPFRLISSTLDR